MRILINHESSLTGEVAEDQLAELYATAEPWLRMNFVSTLDGAATGDSGKSGSINNPVDRQVFHALRRICDAMVVGAGTARIEGYRPSDRPLVVVSRRGELPPRLLDAPPGSVLLATCSSADAGSAREALGADNVLVHGASVDLALLKRQLGERGWTHLLCEGGPHLFGDMLTAGVVDELCATVVPRLVGGEHSRITAGPTVDVPLDLRVLLEQDGTLLGRWFT